MPKLLFPHFGKRITHNLPVSITFTRNLNIRQKLIGVIMITLLSMGSLGAISYYNFDQIEEKFIIVELADDLSNAILEIRRYEKNFFLYAREDDFIETKRYIGEAYNMLLSLRPNVIHEQQVKNLFNIEDSLRVYEQAIETIHLSVITKSKVNSNLIDNLRVTGQELVQLSQNLVNYERQQILKINKSLTDNFLLSSFLIVVLFIFLIIFIIRKVVRPLKIIEYTTKSVAKGKFKKVDVWQSKDEIRQVMLAFNTMVDELERRQDQLVQAQKLSSIGTLASGIAHQVNNPLNNISTSCQILLEECKGAMTEHAAKMLKNIESETFRARDIVRGLLEFSRTHEFVKTTSNLKDIIEKSIRLVSSQIPTDIEIVQQVPTSLELEIDGQRFQEALLNLLINSVHAITPNSGRISIIANEDKEKNLMVLSIEDTGKGIPEKIRHRIFDPFFTTKDVGLGTGLGLYIVYGIIKRHQGTIEVNGLPAGGTKFTISLPIS